MSRIKINIAGLRSNISAMNNYISQLESLNSRLEVLISRIDASWEGKACNAYVTKMRQRLQKSKQMVGVLIAFRSYMQEAVTRFEEKDREGAASIRGC